MARAFVFGFPMFSAGCADLKSMEVLIEALKAQPPKLQTDPAKTPRIAGAANASNAASATAASGSANQGVSIAQFNSPAIDPHNEKVDQMFTRHP
jgi:hypothetical protein